MANPFTDDARQHQMLTIISCSLQVQPVMREVLPCIPATGLLASSRAGRSRDASMPAMPSHEKPADEVNKTVG